MKNFIIYILLIIQEKIYKEGIEYSQQDVIWTKNGYLYRFGTKEHLENFIQKIENYFNEDQNIKIKKIKFTPFYFYKERK